MKRRLFVLFTAVTLATASMLVPGSENVEANSTLQNKINAIKEDRGQTQSEMDKKEAEIKELEREMQLIEKEIRVIDDKTEKTNQQIREKDGEIEATKVRIEELAEEIQIIETRIAERDALLKSRVRSMYKNGGSVDYLEVILGAKSFGDLINRISALNTIAEQDRAILEAHNNDKLMVEEAKLLMEEELITLEDQLQELETLKEKLEEQRKAKDRIMSQLEHEEDELHGELLEIEETDAILAAQERAMKQELAAWKERQKRLEEERRRKEEASRNGTTYNAPPVTAEGDFMRPTTGRITSLHGPRWGRFHHGIDIGKNGRTGDVPIVAVEAGTVIRSYYSSSYGNTVLLSHNVNGKAITTLYAHMENRFVTDGQRVQKGQKLGYMGNTGRSFGAHLHFEVHEGGWNAAKSNSVDPLRYIPKN